MSRLLNESWIEGLPDPIVENLEALNRYVVLRICERIRKIGDIGAADAHRLKSAVEYAAMREVKKADREWNKIMGIGDAKATGKKDECGKVEFF